MQVMEQQKKKYIQSILELKKSKKSQDSALQQLEAIIDNAQNGNGALPLFGLHYGMNCTSLIRKQPDFQLHKQWSSLEKETIKKYLL